MASIKKIISKKSVTLLLVLVWLAAGLSAGLAVRSNNLKMLELREKVFLADKNNSGLEDALRNLQLYVTKHMNTKLPKAGDGKALQLKYSYERRIAEEQNRFQQDSVELSSKAKTACFGEKNEISKVECAQKYIVQNPVKPMATIYPEQYSVEFVSPIFSFDLAGWLIILFLITGVALAVSQFSYLVIKKYNKV